MGRLGWRSRGRRTGKRKVLIACLLACFSSGPGGGFSGWFSTLDGFASPPPGDSGIMGMVRVTSRLSNETCALLAKDR